LLNKAYTTLASSSIPRLFLGRQQSAPFLTEEMAGGEK